MKRPSLFAGLSGYPLMAIVLFMVYAAIVLGWYQDSAPWWLALAAVLAATRTLSAVGQVRRYKAWSAQWQAMSEPVSAQRRIPHPHRSAEVVTQNQPSTAKEPHRGRLLAIVAALLVLAIPAYVGDGSDRVSSALTCLWLAACLYLAFRLLRRLMRRGIKRHEQRTAPQKREAESPFVTWVMDRASSSPSRAEAMRALPDYCARLLWRG